MTDTLMEAIRVVIVDDKPRARDALKALLMTYDGIRVVGEGTNGLDALHLARAERPDVVIMDVVMPRMDGIEATRHLKRTSRATSVILLTMHDEARMQASTAGADALFVKGCTADELVATIHKTASEVDEALLERIQIDYRQMPGLSLTVRQAARLWTLTQARCGRALRILVDRGVLLCTPEGSYQLATRGLQPFARAAIGLD